MRTYQGWCANTLLMCYYFVDVKQVLEFSWYVLDSLQPLAMSSLPHPFFSALSVFTLQGPRSVCRHTVCLLFLPWWQHQLLCHSLFLSRYSLWNSNHFMLCQQSFSCHCVGPGCAPFLLHASGQGMLART